jgi:hypothetical protein
MSMNTQGKIGPEEGEKVAIAALAFVANDPVLLPRFLSLTGIEVSQIRLAASEPGFLAGVLQFIRAHEPTLAAFCESTGITPVDVAGALKALPFGDDSFEAST